MHTAGRMHSIGHFRMRPTVTWSQLLAVSFPTYTHGVIQSLHISVTRVGTSTAVLICIFEVILHKINIPLEETSSVMTVALKSIIFSVYSIFLHATRAFNEYNNREIENKMAESIFVLKLWTQAFITCCCCCCFLL